MILEKVDLLYKKLSNEPERIPLGQVCFLALWERVSFLRRPEGGGGTQRIAMKFGMLVTGRGEGGGDRRII